MYWPQHIKHRTLICSSAVGLKCPEGEGVHARIHRAGCLFCWMPQKCPVRPQGSGWSAWLWELVYECKTHVSQPCLPSLPLQRQGIGHVRSHSVLPKEATPIESGVDLVFPLLYFPLNSSKYTALQLQRWKTFSIPSLYIFGFVLGFSNTIFSPPCRSYP